MSELRPDGWATKSFKSICKSLVNGGTPDTSNPAYWNGSIPWITGADFNPYGLGDFRRYISDLAIRASSTNVVKTGNLLIVTRTGVGKIAIAPCDVAISQDITGVYLDSDQADVRYMFFLMTRGTEELKKLNQGTSINGIIRSDLERYPVLLPNDLSEQRHIAETLEAISQAIVKKESLMAKYKWIKAGLMHALFTRGLDENGQLRCPREAAPELYRHSPLGWIPKNWQVVELGSICQSITSGSRGWAKYYSSDGAIFIRVGNLTRAHPNFRWDSIEHVRTPPSAEGRRTAVESGDILISITADLGMIGIAGNDLGEAYVNQHIALARPDGVKANSRYVGHFLLSEMGQPQFASLNDPGAKAGLNLATVGRLLVAYPASSSEAGSIADTIDSVDRLIKSIRADLTKLEQKKKGLMTDLLTGHVSIRLTYPPDEPAYV
jgi:type I restriction enzyme S subunit